MRRSALAAITQVSLPILNKLDPETAHDLALAGLRWLEPLWPKLEVSPSLSVSCFGLRFAHPLGLAAGFDKNGDYLDALGALGFSHIELGTVTPRPQPGNPKPRMFRVAHGCALINRMGFNNKGVDHLVARLARSRYRGLRGISIGKNFDTPLQNAQDDYLACLRKVYACADYVAVNISSPNTAGLRELQERDGLQRILGSLLEERRALQGRFGKRVPLLVKIAPDLGEAEIGALAQNLRTLRVDGVIATNTFALEHAGGLSGAPLHPISLKVISRLRAELGASFPIIGVGGIVNADSALSTLRAGANLLQIYTGFAYRGSALLEEILRALPA
ncbi:MAG: quinone-dependent dihydroorotate dehydrogenase [Steroidobacteraceae bacterium]